MLEITSCFSLQRKIVLGGEQRCMNSGRRGGGGGREVGRSKHGVMKHAPLNFKFFELAFFEDK